MTLATMRMQRAAGNTLGGPQPPAKLLLGRCVTSCRRQRPTRQPRAPAAAETAAAASSGGAPAAAGAAVITDAAVPEGHKGLHGFLYGEGGAEAHDGPTSSYDFREVRCCLGGCWLSANS